MGAMKQSQCLRYIKKLKDNKLTKVQAITNQITSTTIKRATRQIMAAGGVTNTQTTGQIKQHLNARIRAKEAMNTFLTMQTHTSTRPGWPLALMARESTLIVVTTS